MVGVGTLALQNPCVLTKVREAVQRYGLLKPGEKVVVAVSGGADSMALLYALHALSAEWNLTLVVAHLDHGIRPDTALDLEVVQQATQALGLPLAFAKVDVPALARARKLSLEEAGREARRAFLEETAHKAKASKIALGHTRTDLAETVLLHLVRGAGPRGWQGFRPFAPPYIRPLVLCSRGETRAFCQAQGIPFRDDPTNEDLRLPRNRVRLVVLPELRKVNPRVEEALARAAELCDPARRIPQLAEVLLPGGVTEQIRPWTRWLGPRSKRWARFSGTGAWTWRPCAPCLPACRPWSSKGRPRGQG